MNYLDNEQKRKMEKILNLQNNIEASKEKQEERISSYDDYYNNNITNKAEEELKMKELQMLKIQRDKKKKLEKKMNDWAHHQAKISEIRIKNDEKKKNKDVNNDIYDKEKEEEVNNNNYNEAFDISKYNVISLDNMKNNEDNNSENNNDKNDEKKNEINSNINEFICMICQRKFASAEKLALHEKLSELHKQNLNKLKLNNN